MSNLENDTDILTRRPDLAEAFGVTPESDDVASRRPDLAEAFGVTPESDDVASRRPDLAKAFGAIPEDLGTPQPAAPAPASTVPAVSGKRRESGFRGIVSKYIGGGTTAQRISQNEPGVYESVKGGLNQMMDPQDAVASALMDSKGDIDKAIEIANKTHESESHMASFDTMGDNPFAMISAIKSAKFSPAADQLTKLKAELDAAGVAPEDRPRIIQDTAKAIAWTEKDDDNIRQLSTGEIAINPGRLFGQRDQLIKEINASNAAPEDKEEAIRRLDAMRAASADKLANDLHYGDTRLFGIGEFRDFAEGKEGMDTTTLLDEWIAKQKDRNFIFKLNDALWSGVAKGEIGIGKTVVGGLAGVTGSEALAIAQQTLSGARESVSKAERMRGLTGAYGITSDLADTVTQMMPMFAGGMYAQGLQGLSKSVVGGMSVYGWAAAQGYESKLDDAVSMAREAKGSDLTPQEITKVLGDRKTQIAAFLNGVQTAALSKILGGGTERAALGKAAESMTVRDFIAGGGTKALRDGTLKQEIKAMGKTIFADASDESIEEFTNQILDGAISTVALGKDMKLGDLLDESFKAGALGGLVGGAIPQVRRTPAEEAASQLEIQAAGALPESAVASRETTTTDDTKTPTPLTDENPPAEMSVPAVQTSEPGAAEAGPPVVSEAGTSPVEGTAGPAPDLTNEPTQPQPAEASVPETAQEDVPPGMPEAGVQSPSGEPAVAEKDEIAIDAALQSATTSPLGSSNFEGYPSLTPSTGGKTRSAKAESVVQLPPEQKPIKESQDGLAGKDGTVLKSEFGRIEIKHKNMLGAPRKQSVMDFVVDESARGRGEGTHLVREAKRRFPDLGAQVSSTASLKVFYNEGFRNPQMPTASFEEHEAVRRSRGESIFMALNDEKGKPYVTPTQAQEYVRPSGQYGQETQGSGGVPISEDAEAGGAGPKMGTEQGSQELLGGVQRGTEAGTGTRGEPSGAAGSGVAEGRTAEIVTRRLNRLFGPNFESMLTEARDLLKRNTMPKKQEDLRETLAVLVANKGFGSKSDPKAPIARKIVDAMVTGKPNIVDKILVLDDIPVSEVTKSQTWGSVLGSVGYELEGKKYVHPRKPQPQPTNEQNPQGTPGQKATPEAAQAEAPVEGGPETGKAGGAGVQSPSGEPAVADTSHLDALELGLSRARERARGAKTPSEKKSRDLAVRQYKKEIADEKKFLGMPEEDGPDMTDEELLAALEEPSAKKTRLDLYLDEVEKSGELRVDIEGGRQGISREQIDKVTAAAEARGMTAAFDGSGFLIRKNQVTEPPSLGTPRPGFANQFVTPEGATIELLLDSKASFMVPPDQRGKGAGNAAVERVKQYADATGQTIKLDIEPLGNEPRMNRAELADWYERRGFTVSEDRKSAIYQPTKPTNEQNPQGTPGQKATPEAAQAEAPVEGGPETGKAGGAGAVSPYSVESLKTAFNLTDEQAVVADAIAKAQGAKVDYVAKGGVPGSGALSQSDSRFKDIAPDGILYRADIIEPTESKRGAYFFSGDKAYTDNYLSSERSLIAAKIPKKVLDIRDPKDQKVMVKWLKSESTRLMKSDSMKSFRAANDINKALAKEDKLGGINQAFAIADIAHGEETGVGIYPGISYKAFLEAVGYDAMTVGESITGTRDKPADFSFAILNPEIVKPDATAADTARFNELTRDLPASPTQADLDAWKASHPDEYQELKAMRERVLREAGYDVGPVYHGTSADFTIFNAEMGGLVTGARSARQGFFLVDDQSVAGQYAKLAVEETGEGSERIISGLLSGNLKTVDHGGKSYEERKFSSELTRAKSEGYEGVKFLNTDDSVFKELTGFEPLPEVETEVSPDGKFMSFQRGGFKARGEVLSNGMTRLITPGGLVELVRSTDPVRVAAVFEDISNRAISPKPIYKENRHTVYAVFDPTQIKSTEPLSLSPEGKLITPDQWGDTGSPSILYQDAPAAPDFYSTLTRAVEQKIPARATPEQIMATIRGAGVKPEEIKWSGLATWLQGRDKVSKDDVLEFLRNEGAVRFEEVTFADSKDLAAELNRQLETGEIERLEYTRRYNEITDGIPPSKFSQYTLPGGSNYREVVLAMSNAGFEEWVKRRGVSDFSKLEAGKQKAMIDEFSREKGLGYTSSHFPDVPNYVAHMRTNERDGGLFIEELQSDRHQEGRKKGYTKTKEETDEEFQTLSRKTDRSPQEQERLDELFALVMSGQTEKGGIADAPFRTTWPLALFKRALRDAVAGGKTWIGWTTGETQNDRFDLSKQVDSIDAVYQSDGTIDITGRKDGAGIIEQNTTPDKLADFVGKDLAGKILAKPKASGVVHSFKGEDLKVGGSGMKGFYDVMLPKEIGKYVKQWGGKVERSTLKPSNTQSAWAFQDSDGMYVVKDKKDGGDPSAKIIAEFADAEEVMLFASNYQGEGTPIWRIDITPEMRKSISEAGQPLFQQNKASFEIVESGKILLRGLQNPDFSSAVHEIAHAARRSMSKVLDEKEVRTVEQWAGVKKGKWGKYAEEKWARAWERYFAEGKAPQKYLQPVFDKIAGWMAKVYSTITGSPIDVEITPEVRAVMDKLASRMEVPESAGTPETAVGETPAQVPKTTETARPNQAADLEWWLGALSKVEGLNGKERAHTRLIVEGKEAKGTHAYATINRPPSQIALGRGRAYDEQGLLVTDSPLSIDEQMSLQVVPVDSETTTATAKQLFAKGFELENNDKTYLVTPSTTSNSLRVTELDAEGPTGHIHLDNRFFVSDLRKYLLGAKVFDERAPETSPPPTPEFGNPPVNPLTTEPLDPNPPPPELPDFKAALSDDSVTGLYHAQTDADRARLGLPPRFKQPHTTDQAAWDRATAAEDAHRAAGKPGTAGTDLLTLLLNSPPRVLTKDEHALLLHEKLVREQAVKKAQERLNALSADAPDGVRKDAQAGVRKAQDAFDQLLTYADAAGSRAGLSLQARKMLVNTDFSLAAVTNRLRAAKNIYTDKPAEWTEKDQKAAVEIATKLQQAQARIEALEARNEALEAGNDEQVLLIEQLTRDVERAQTRLENKMRTSRARKMVKEKLDPLVEAAKARRAARKGKDVLFQSDSPTSEMAEDLKDIAIIASGWFVDKTLTLQEFSSRLISEFGDRIAQFAQRVFHQARSIYIENAESVSDGSAPTPETVVDSIDADEPLTKEDVWRLARAHVIAGQRGRNVLDAVFGDLEPIFPGLTREEVSNLFTGYGKVVYPSDKEVPKELRRIRSLEREYAKQLDIAAGQMPKRTGYQGDVKKDASWAEVRAEQQKTAEALRELENQLREAGLPVPADEKKLANALSTMKRRLSNEIEEIELALATRTPRTPKTRMPVTPDAEAEALKKRLDEKRAEYAQVFKDETARERRILGSIKKRTAELERRMRDKDFDRPPAKEPLNTEAKRKADYEFSKVKARYEEMRNDYAIKNAPFMTKAGHYMMSSGNLLKVMTLGGDLGVVMRQLGTSYQALIRDLGMFAPTKEGAKRRADGSYLRKIFTEGARAFGSREYEHTAYERLMERQNAGWDKTAGLVLNAPFDIQRNMKEDIPAANMLDKIPWWVWPAIAGVKVSLLGASFPVAATLISLGIVTKPLMQALDRAQRTMTNQSRALFFDAGLAALHDGNPTVKEAKAIAKAVMVGTGRGTAGQKIESAIPFLNQVLLATRYYFSRIQALTLYPIFNKDARSSRAAQKEIARMYARSVAGRAVLYGLAALAFGKALTGDDDDPEEGLISDMRSPNFGKLKLAKGVYADFMSSMNGFASTAARLFTHTRVDPQTGEKIALGAGFMNNVNDEALRFLKSKFNLSTSFLWNTMVTRQYYGGKPVNPGTILDEATTAIIVNDTFNVYKVMMEEYGPVVGAARATVFLGLMFGGAGTSVSDSDAEKEANAMAKKEAEYERKVRQAELNEP